MIFLPQATNLASFPVLIPQLLSLAVQIALLVLQARIAVVEDWEQGYPVLGSGACK